MACTSLIDCICYKQILTEIITCKNRFIDSYFNIFNFFRNIFPDAFLLDASIIISYMQFLKKLY